MSDSAETWKYAEAPCHIFLDLDPSARTALIARLLCGISDLRGKYMAVSVSAGSGTWIGLSIN